MDLSNIYLRQFAQIYHKADFYMHFSHKAVAVFVRPRYCIVTADLILTQRIYNYITVRKQMKLDRRRACTCGIVVVIPGLDSAVRICRIGSDILYVILID